METILDTSGINHNSSSCSTLSDVDFQIGDICMLNINISICNVYISLFHKNIIVCNTDVCIKWAKKNIIYKYGYLYFKK